MSKRHNKHINLSDALKEFVSENNLQSGLDKINVAHTWEELMGKGVNNYTSSVKLDKDTLYVQLTSSVLREELSYGKEKIVRMINEALGKELIKKLVLR